MQLKINGKKVYFTSLGSGKQILILPGWMHDHKVWELAQQELAKHFQVLVLDFPGFGDSQLDPSIKDLNDYARFLKKVVDELCLKDFILLGHSFGGSVAIKILSLYPKLPIEKLILCDSAGIKKFNIKQIIGLILAKGGKPIFTLPVFRTYALQVKRMLYGLLNEKDYFNAGPLKSVMSRILKENLEGVLDKITVSTLIIWGEKDNVTPLSHAQVLRKRIKGSKLILVSKSTHWPFMENVVDFTRFVKDFVYEK